MPYHGLGSGITRVLRSWSNIDFVDDHEGCLFSAVIHRNPLLLRKKSEKKPASPTTMSEKILAFLQSDPLHTVSQLAKALGVTTRTVERMIVTLRKEGRLRRIGPAKGGRWEVVQ